MKRNLQSTIAAVVISISVMSVPESFASMDPAASLSKWYNSQFELAKSSIHSLYSPSKGDSRIRRTASNDIGTAIISHSEETAEEAASRIEEEAKRVAEDAAKRITTHKDSYISQLENAQSEIIDQGIIKEDFEEFASQQQEKADQEIEEHARKVVEEFILEQ